MAQSRLHTIEIWVTVEVMFNLEFRAKTVTDKWNDSMSRKPKIDKLNPSGTTKRSSLLTTNSVLRVSNSVR